MAREGKEDSGIGDLGGIGVTTNDTLIEVNVALGKDTERRSTQRERGGELNYTTSQLH